MARGLTGYACRSARLVAKMLRNAAGWPTVHNPAAFSLLQW